jgi:hypothetical protein
MREFFENLYLIKVEHLEEIDTFLDAFDLSKLRQKHVNQINR